MVLTVPCRLDVGQGNTPRVNAKFTSCGVSHNLSVGLVENILRWNSRCAENYERSATQDCGGKRNGWPGAFPNLDEARLDRDGSKVRTSDRSKE